MKIKPVEYKVLIKPEKIEAKTQGGLYLPEQTQSKEQMAQVKGKIIAIGGNAFDDWSGDKPKVGDIVYYSKYAGMIMNDPDFEGYSLINDKDIVAIIGD